MKRILVSGATGNIGTEVIRFLYALNTPHQIIAGVRNPGKAKKAFSDFPALLYQHFDFEDPSTFDEALEAIDSIFLLRPPHISDIDRYFRPLVYKLKENKVAEVVFLSVQGAEKSSVIPHNKIEKLIRQAGLQYIILRPAYFMQNLSTTLLSDIRTKRRIILPAGRAKFNWIDVENIGETAAILLHRFPEFKNQAIELTGYENEDFYKVVALMNHILKIEVEYNSTPLLRFFWSRKKEGMAAGKILVMAMLHFLPRFQEAPRISNFYEALSGKKPTTLSEFLEREKAVFIK